MASVELCLVLCVLCLQFAINASGLHCHVYVERTKTGKAVNCGRGPSTLHPCNTLDDVKAVTALLPAANQEVPRSGQATGDDGVFNCVAHSAKSSSAGSITLRYCQYTTAAVISRCTRHIDNFAQTSCHNCGENRGHGSACNAAPTALNCNGCSPKDGADQCVFGNYQPQCNSSMDVNTSRAQFRESNVELYNALNVTTQVVGRPKYQCYEVIGVEGFEAYARGCTDLSVDEFKVALGKSPATLKADVRLCGDFEVDLFICNTNIGTTATTTSTDLPPSGDQERPASGGNQLFRECSNLGLIGLIISIMGRLGWAAFSSHK